MRLRSALLLLLLAASVRADAPVSVQAQSVQAQSVQVQSVQAQIDAAAPGTTVTLPAGTYPVHGLRPKSGVSLSGAGQDETIIVTEAVLPGCANVTVSNLTLRNSGPNYLLTTTGRPARIAFRNVTFDQGAGLPPHMTNVDGLTLTECLLDGWHSRLGAPSFDGCTGLSIQKCVFYHQRGRVTLRFTRNALVAGCQDRYGNQPTPGDANPLEVGGLDVSWTDGARLLNNDVRGVGLIDRTRNSGEAMLAQASPPAPYKDYPSWDYSCVVKNLLVQDCKFSNSRYPVELYNGGLACTFSHNALSGVPGINLRGDFTHGHRYPVSGCTVTGCTVDGSPTGATVWQQGGGVNGVNVINGRTSNGRTSNGVSN